MEDLLTPLKTTAISVSTHQQEPPLLQSAATKTSTAQPPRGYESKKCVTYSNPDEVLEALRSKPQVEELRSALRFLRKQPSAEGSFDITKPGPKAAQIINVLVTSIIPDFWDSLVPPEVDNQVQILPVEIKYLLECLTSVTGLGAIVAKLRSLCILYKEGKANIQRLDVTAQLAALHHALSLIVSTPTFLKTLYENAWIKTKDPAKQAGLWRETLAVISSGKLVSAAIEAEDIVKAEAKEIGQKSPSSLQSGKRYSELLATFIAELALKSNANIEEDLPWRPLAQLLGKTGSIGFRDELFEKFYSKVLLENNPAAWPQFHAVFSKLVMHEQRNALVSMLRTLSKWLPSKIQNWVEDGALHERESNEIAGIAAVISGVIKHNDMLKDFIVSWLTGNLGGLASGIGINRAILAALLPDEDKLQAVLEKTLQDFADKLYIKHAPVLEQEANTQILLLSAGYINRVFPQFVSNLAKSGLYLNGISNRLAASSERSRFLGMIVGTAISELVDKPDKRMNFGLEELESDESKWYRSLIQFQDRIGEIKDLVGRQIERKDVKGKKPMKRKETTAVAPVSAKSKIISIEEVASGSDTEDDLVPYDKPDSDPEDSDDDPTLVRRGKPTAPVYIRDLITYLRSTDNFDHQRLALLTAPNLIRRKANFGTEVSSHADELATLLTGLSDKFEIADFAKMRLQGMIAILISQPLKMGQWFAKTFFDGDYSLSQRLSILTTLGLGARELGGLKGEDGDLTGANTPPEASFPSKLLPSKLHKLYAGPSTSLIDSIASQLESTMIQPLAIEAADQLSGPNALKVRTFSSRLAVNAKRTKAIPNALAKVVADGFFFPLTGRWWVQMRTYGDKHVQYTPMVLAHFLKTLALILHASGRATLALPQMTREFWDLLLAVRAEALAAESNVLEALLFAFLTLLDVNEDKRRLADDHARELLETMKWAEMVMGQHRGGEAEGDRVRGLAAGVLVRCQEVVEKYQRLLMGDMVAL